LRFQLLLHQQTCQHLTKKTCLITSPSNCTSNLLIKLSSLVAKMSKVSLLLKLSISLPLNQPIKLLLSASYIKL
jgi:hypothetical protein